MHVMVGFDQPVHHLGKIFSLYAEFPRAAALAERQHHVARAILGFGGRDREDAVLLLLAIFDFFTQANLEIGTFADFLPESYQVLFGQFGLLEFSIRDRKSTRLNSSHQIISY